MGTTFSPALTDRGSSSRGLSNALWQGLSTDLAGTRPGTSFFKLYDFQEDVDTTDIWAVTQAGSAGTMTQDATVGNIGVAKIDSGDNDAGDGATVRGGPWLTPAAGSTVYWEARVKVTANTTGPQLFMGLCDATTAVITGAGTAVVNTTNVTDAVAVTTVTGDDGGNALITYMDETGESAVEGSSTLHTLVADTYVKIGARVNGTDTVGFYVDGVLTQTHDAATSSSAGTIPTVPMQLALVCQSDGTTQPVLHVDWVAVGVADFAI